MSDQPANLNITDIADAVKVIDYASEQGAFRGWTNIRQILALRDRLDLFVGAASSATTATPPVSADVPMTSPFSEDDVEGVSAPEDALAAVDSIPPVARRRRPRVAAR